ncbi:MAG: cation-translocating P-type ATPase, partial [Clostridia bacterium]|nr:cation-translocating P-type ATPase [Clostridia bacterium]
HDLKEYKDELDVSCPRIGEAPFDSIRKMMSTVHREGDKIVQYTKGACEELLARCDYYWEGGEIRPITEEYRQKVRLRNKEFADRALRVLGAAMRFWPQMPTDFEPETLENHMVFIGFVGMIDPCRPEVYDAVRQCKKAGIRPIMITGDHIDTAVAIAKDLGILGEGQRAVTGAEIGEMSDEEFEKQFRDISVYARVQPEHKTRIVNAWRKAGCVTAMTGDGVNDAPSIKSADIGVGMGITGTDVTKNVADMVLADDNFATIVGAVEEGRRIYDNIRKAIQFLLGSNMSEVITIFVATLFITAAGAQILKPVHLLWINLITDSLPALALGMEQAERDIMLRKPRSASDGVFAGGMGFDIAYQGVMVATLTLLSYWFGSHGAFGIAASPETGTTMAFLTMSMAEIFHSFNLRSQRGSIFAIKGQNRMLWISLAVAALLTVLVCEVPFLAKLFDFMQADARQFFIAVGLGVLVIPIVEPVKLVQRKLFK